MSSGVNASTHKISKSQLFELLVFGNHTGSAVCCEKRKKSQSTLDAKKVDKEKSAKGSPGKDKAKPSMNKGKSGKDPAKDKSKKGKDDKANDIKGKQNADKNAQQVEEKADDNKDDAILKQAVKVKAQSR